MHTADLLSHGRRAVRSYTAGKGELVQKKGPLRYRCGVPQALQAIGGRAGETTPEYVAVHGLSRFWPGGGMTARHTHCAATAKPY